MLSLHRCTLFVLLMSFCLTAFAQKALSPKHPDHQKNYIVVFDDQPLAAVARNLKASVKPVAKSSTQLGSKSLGVNANKNALATELTKQKNTRASYAEFLGKKRTASQITAQYSQLLNGVAVQSSLSIDELKQHEKVKSVYEVNTYRAKLASSLPIISADNAWQVVNGKANAGSGVKIAIIDSGIMPEHPMFSDQGFTAPENYSPEKADYCQQQPSFCNNKLILARHYPPQGYNFSFNDEVDSPYATYSHGVHVAGIATGREISTETGESFSGTAPGAYLMVYKALWGKEGISTDVELIQALEDAYQDGANIINNSWGGEIGADPITTLYQTLFTELEANGVVLVSAAGNEGTYGESSINCPACVEAGIAVAATTTTKAVGHLLTFNDQQVLSTPGDNYITGQTFSGQALFAEETNINACLPFDSHYFADKVAVVYRGTCLFSEKANNVKAAGAIAMIVINNETGTNIGMVMEGSNLLSTFISQTDGDILTQALQQQPDADVSMAGKTSSYYSDAEQDYIASFSSLGPNGDAAILKPDIAAPGRAILSASLAVQSDEGYQQYQELSGTSMASPFVAGAAAIVKQHRPSLTAKQIKSVLLNASDGNIKSYVNDQATPFETGAGRLNIEAALTLPAYSNVANMAFANCGITCQQSNQLISLSTEVQTWQGEVHFNDALASAELSPNQIVFEQENATEDYLLTINLPYSPEKEWYFGEVIWRNDQGQTLRQAVAAQAKNASSELISLNVPNSNITEKFITLESTNTSEQKVLNYQINIVGAAQFQATDLNTHTNANISEVFWQEKSLSFTSELAVAELVASSSGLPFNIDISQQQDVQKVTCSDSCDEFTFPINFNFQYLSKPYTSITVSDNGVALAGNQYVENGLLSTNLPIPNTQSPNAIIAPFWLDFNLLNPSKFNDTGGGEILYYTHQYQNSNYLIIQWHKAKIWVDDLLGFGTDYWGISDENSEFTFQLIIEKNSNNLWFNYLDIPELPHFYTVGLENDSGSFGEEVAFDGQSSIDIFSGQNIAFDYQAAGSLALALKTLPLEINDFAVADEISTQTNSSVLIKPLNNDLSQTSSAMVIAKVANKTINQNLYYNQQSSLIIDTLAITQPPEFGTASVNGAGGIIYQPESNFVGFDEIHYQVMNSQGQSASATILVTVGEPLSVSIETNNNITDNSVNNFSAQVSNAVGEVHYQWHLPDSAGNEGSGIKDFDATSLTQQSLQLITPTFLSASKQQISVTVTDDESSVTSSLSFIVEAKNQAPEQVTISGPTNLSENQLVTFTANAIDEDSELSFQWKVAAGLNIESVNDNVITVKLTDSSVNQTAITVTVHDGEYTVNKQLSLTVAAKSDSGGGSIAWQLLLGLLLVRMINRKHTKL